jgi:glycosyltransferase involved in cell wall biosynthesis
MITSLPSLSIVIPAYNTEKYISACLESVFKQDPNPDQIIIINDGSTDNTAAILDLYKDLPSVIILHTENHGPGLARNTGLLHVRTDYVHFLDSDDMLAPNFVAKVKKLIIESGHADLILFSSVVIDDAGTEIKIMTKRQTHFIGNITGPKGSLLSQMQGANILHPNFHTFGISKVNIWLNNNIIFPKYYHEDEAILYPFVSSIESVYVTDELLYIRRHRENSIMTTNKSPNHALGALSVAQNTLTYYMKQRYIPKADRRLWIVRISNYTIYYMRICAEIKMKISYKDIFKIVFQMKSPKLLLRVITH